MIITNRYNENHIGIVALCLALYFVMMPLDSFPVFGMGSFLKVIVILPLCSIFFTGNVYKIYNNNLTRACFFYLVYSLFSVFYSVDFDLSLNSFIRLFLNMVVIIATGAMYTSYNEKEIRFLKKSLVLGGVFTLLLTILFSDYSASNRLTMAVNGGSQDQNYINGYLLFALAAFTCNLFKDRKFWAIIPIIAILIFALFTGSRGALVTITGVVAVLFAKHTFKDRKKRVLILTIASASIFGVCILWEDMLALLPNEVAIRFSIDYLAENGTTSRANIWRHLLEVYANSSIMRQLFGYGYLTAATINQYNGLVAHNIWIDHLIGSGLIGMIIFTYMQYEFLEAAIKTNDDFLIGSYIGYLIMCMSLSLVSYKPIWNCMIMILIVTIAFVRERKQLYYLNKEQKNGENL